MISNERGYQLHVRSCLGENLTQVERAELDAWYAAQDDIETAVFRASAQASEEEILRQVDAGLHRLAKLRDRAEELETGNRELEAEVGKLTKQLKKRLAVTR